MNDPVPFQPMSDEAIEQARRDRLQARIEEARKILQDACQRLKLMPVCIETRCNGQLQSISIDFIEAK